MSGTSGLATAIGLAGGFGDLGLDASEQQDDMFDDAVDAPSSLPPAKLGPRPAHRPKGSRNRSTEEMRRFVLSRHQSPLLGLAETWSRSAEQLAQDLSLTRIVKHLAPGQTAIKTIDEIEKNEDGEITVTKGYLVWDAAAAFQLQQGARVAALPYLHQKLPQAIEVAAKTRGVLVIGALADEETEQDTGLALPLPPAGPTQQYQQVIDAEVVKSHDQQSHDLSNALSFQENDLE